MSDPTSPVRELRDGTPMVVWTDANGCRRTAVDRCPHRRAPLSAGTVEDGLLRCPYHGWAYDGDGTCVEIPALGTDARVPSRARLEMASTDGPGASPGAPPVGSRWLDGDTPGLEHFWHPVARIGEIPPGEPTAVELLGRTWVVTRDGSGGATAVGADDEPAAATAVHLDHVWIAPCPPRSSLPVVDEWQSEGWSHRRLNRAEGRFGVGLLLDNQLDSGHFAFVHRATFGRPETALIPPAPVDRTATTASTVLRVPIAARNDPDAGAGDHPVEQHRTMHYEFHAPLWLRLQLDYEEMGGSTLLLFAFVPLAAGRARMDVDVLFRRPGGFTDADLDERMAFEEVVVGEDLRLQRLFDDLRLPLDPTGELHTRADRYSVACRDLIRTVLDEVTATT